MWHTSTPEQEQFGECGVDEEIDARIQAAYDLANWAMEEAQAANDLLVMLVEVVARAQPETATKFLNRIQSMMNSPDVLKNGAFENNARRLCGLIDGKEPYFESFHTNTSDKEAPKRPARPALRIVKKDDDKGA